VAFRLQMETSANDATNLKGIKMKTLAIVLAVACILTVNSAIAANVVLGSGESKQIGTDTVICEKVKMKFETLSDEMLLAYSDTGLLGICKLTKYDSGAANFYIDDKSSKFFNTLKSGLEYLRLILKDPRNPCGI
jgi:hypothetical protein